MNNYIRLSMIAAIGKNRELGKDNKLLFDIKKDMMRFKEITTDHAVIMGRKTFESIGRALPNRNNIVVTRDENYNAPEGVTKASTVEAALGVAKKYEEGRLKQNPEAVGEVFVIGGGQIYKEFLPYADKLYLTIVDKETSADSFFPEYDKDFKRMISSRGEEENGIRFTFIELEK